MKRAHSNTVDGHGGPGALEPTMGQVLEGPITKGFPFWRAREPGARTTRMQMEWINFHVSNLDKVEFRAAEAPDRGTWLFLLRYCVGQEAGDRIRGCRSWSDQTWQKTCAVTAADVMRESALWEWEGEDLIVGFY